MSTITGLESNQFERNWALGFYFDIRLKNQWFIDTGVLVKATFGNAKLTSNDLALIGFEDYDAEGNYGQRLNYFIVPVLAKYKFKNNLYAEIGPQFGLLAKGWVEYNYKDNDNNIHYNLKKYNTDTMNRIDAGMTVGVGYRLLKGLGWTIGAKYYYGFVNVYKGIQGTKNSTILLKVNIPIGLSQEKKDIIRVEKDKNKEKKETKKEIKRKEKESTQKYKEKQIKKQEKATKKNN